MKYLSHNHSGFLFIISHWQIICLTLWLYVGIIRLLVTTFTLQFELQLFVCLWNSFEAQKFLSQRETWMQESRARKCLQNVGNNLRETVIYTLNQVYIVNHPFPRIYVWSTNPQSYNQ